MASNTWARFAVGCVVAAATASPVKAQSLDENPVIAITIENQSGLIASSLAEAQAVVSGIFDRAGVTVRWDRGEVTEADRVLTVILATSGAFAAGLSADAVGVVPSAGDGTRGTLAYVFIDRIAAFATKYRVAHAQLLAFAIAHEIGHLLLPANAHRPDSVMREAWHPSLFPPRSPGILGFPSDQARLLRLRARRP